MPTIYCYSSLADALRLGQVSTKMMLKKRKKGRVKKRTLKKKGGTVEWTTQYHVRPGSSS